MKISEIITDKYKLRIPPTVYYDLLADVVEAEEEQELCDDAISRDAVLDLCDSKDPDYKVIHFKEDVECLPPVTQKYTVFHCPKCGYQDAREL